MRMNNDNENMNMKKLKCGYNQGYLAAITHKLEILRLKMGMYV